jgi:hypothetical protein
MLAFALKKSIKFDPRCEVIDIIANARRGRPGGGVSISKLGYRQHHFQLRANSNTPAMSLVLLFGPVKGVTSRVEKLQVLVRGSKLPGDFLPISSSVL